ncbi:MAG: porin [Candidatus Symbiodolus clandestinus]
MMRPLKTAVTPMLLMATLTNVQAHILYEEGDKKLELIGKVLLERDFSKDKGKEGDQSALRLGLKGEMPMADDLKAGEMIKLFGQLELGKSLTPAPVNTRAAVIGIEGESIGKLSYGRTLGVMSEVTGFTGILPVSCNDALGDGADRFGTGRATGLLRWYTPKVQGVQLAVQYLPKNSAEDSKETEKHKDKQLKGSNGDGYGVALTHDTGMGLTWGAAYNQGAKNLKQKQRYHNPNRPEMFAVSVKYDHELFYVAAAYAQTRNQLFFNNKALICQSGVAKPAEQGVFAKESQGFEAVAKYKFANGLQPTVGYLQSTVTLKDDIYDTKEKNVHFVDVGCNYELSKQFSVAADYKVNLLKEDKAKILGVSAENILGIGLTYVF